ncbi:hypothetical protein GCM10007906_38190 [Vibrio hyugaensis]|uniref:Secreted RxLR effector peptide protein n=1 Tax=Vibrio hyugaensis TaxID=1534743 RepID=A0ABQ5Y5I3_9VIBR|nr:hypothetical protein [Vibrio hyugaensis]GLR06231.1 hypothetical protein GCM10007906_38190 [Vibrio hyugaensis]
MRAYLVCVLGLFVALMAFELSQEQPSPKLSHAIAFTTSLTDGEAHFEEVPFSPRRKVAASLLSRNALRVNHSNSTTDTNDLDVLSARWLTVAAESTKRFVSSFVSAILQTFYPHFKYRIGGRQESNLIYRFMHAR